MISGGNLFRSRLPGVALISALLLGACTGSEATPTPTGPSSTSETTPAPDDASTITSTPSPTAEPSVTVEDNVEAAYRRYLTSTAAAMESGDPAEIAAARGQALAAAQARVAVLSSQGRMARGAFVPVIQSLDVEDRRARLRDCYAADIVEFDEESDEQVADRGGTRFAAAVELVREEGDWTVVEFTEGDFCVPADLAADLEDRYLRFWEVVNAVGQPPDPDHPDLADVAAGEQLDGLRDRLRDFQSEGYEVRDASVSHPKAVKVSQSDTVAVVRDCLTLDPDGGVYDAATGDLVTGGAEPGTRSLWEAHLELIDDTWKVVDADVIEEDSGCDRAAF